jgi:hypothetical protein
MMGKTRQTANLVSKNNLFVDKDNGFVGVGTDDPTSKLDVVGIVSATEYYENGKPLINKVKSTAIGITLIFG